MAYRVLAVGDTVGSPGLEYVRRQLRAIRRELNADFVCVNGENANVVGVTPRQVDGLLSAGADCVTLGNHTWTRWELQPYLDEEPRVLRPANFAPQCPGRGMASFDSPAGPVTVINLIGRFTLDPNTDNPFLTADALLEEAPLAERYPAGKRSGSHSMPQEEISALLVRLAREGKTVVRLKGGDPFVFGRGGEEILALQEAGIPFEEVPGISSAVAIPAEAGIPVTHRELSRSFHVITGRTAAGGELLPESLQALAALQGTLVFLMGLGGLERIAAGLIAAGKSPQTPAAVVSGGNSPSPANLRGTLETIAEQARAAAVQAPAVIVVGETAALHLESGISRSLRGVSVGLTGTPAFAAKLADTLRPLGARTFPLLTARIRPLPLEFDLSRLGDGAGKWIVLTSANGVSCFFDLLNREKIDLRSLKGCKFAVIGRATGEALARHGVFADLCPGRATGEDLAAALCAAVRPPETALLFRAAGSSPALGKALEGSRIPVEEHSLYETVYVPCEPQEQPDYLTFASAGSVRAYFRAFGAPPESCTCVCIGPVTAAALQERTPAPFLTAPDISAASIASAILHHKTSAFFRRKRGHEL